MNLQAFLQNVAETYSLSLSDLKDETKNYFNEKEFNALFLK